MSSRKGFTLIELMIVIAIIAIIAAIAIPGLLSSQRASHERNASSSLKTLASAEAVFKSHDSDNNKVNDFWTGDVAGLYCMTSAAIVGIGDPPIKLIEVSVAAADSFPLAAGAAGGEYAVISTFGTQSMKAGYWYYALNIDQSVAPVETYRADTGGNPLMGAVHNNSRFGFGAYPDSFGSSGKLAFVINEGNTMFKRQLPASIKPSAATPPGAMVDVNYVDWPSDATVSAQWSRMD